MLCQIDEIFEPWVDNLGAGCQLLVTYKGETVIDKCYGYANMETATPITQDTVFHVASVSKQFTAMAILMLHERGALSVFDDVRKYIPDLIKFSQPLTIKQMMNHVSGLREHYTLFRLQGRSIDDCITQEEIIRLNARQKSLNFEPGEEFMYSNANYVYMAVIVERVTGMPFAQFAKNYIFEPLGMKASFFRNDSTMIIPGRASSYRDDGYNYHNAIFNITVHGDSGLNTTCRDLTTFLKQYQNPTLISRKTMEELMFHIPKIKKGSTVYGGGLRFNEMLGHRHIHHGGVNAGFRTFGVLFPDDDLIITVFANTQTLPIEIAGRDVARIVLGLPPRQKRSIEPFRNADISPDSISGMYYCDANMESFEINVRQNMVFYGDVALVHVGDNVYKQGRLEVTFAFGEDTVLLRDDIIFHLRKVDGNVCEEIAKPLEGVYYNDELRALYTVSYSDGKLWWDHIRLGKQELHILEGDTFFYGNQTLRFEKNEDGYATGCVYCNALVRNVVFKKIDDTILRNAPLLV